MVAYTLANDGSRWGAFIVGPNGFRVNLVKPEDDQKIIDELNRLWEAKEPK